MKNSSSLKSGWVQRCSSVLMSAVLITLTGCATGPTADRRDPLEPFNRGVYKFNDVVDRAVIKPVATAYRDVLPSPIRTGVNNFFNNLQDAWSAVNSALQLKGQAAGNNLVRFGVNTFLGLGGVLDIASEMRVERHSCALAEHRIQAPNAGACTSQTSDNRTKDTATPLALLLQEKIPFQLLRNS